MSRSPRVIPAESVPRPLRTGGRTPLRVLALLLLIALGPRGAVRAGGMDQLAEEGGGFRPNHLFVEGPGDDAVSPLSGDVEVSVRVGPKLPAGGGLALELALRYSSKIWVHYATTADVRYLKRLGPFGVGWRLHLGRLYASCRNGCDASAAMGHLEWVYEAADGALHPIAFDVPTGGLRYHGTTDATYIRAEALDAGGRVVETDRPAAETAVWRLYMGDGVVHTLARRLELVDGEHGGDRSDDFRGWYTTRIERWDVPGHAVGAIEVSYEDDPALAHCIRRIDLLAPDGSGTLASQRHVDFVNGARLDPLDPATTVEGGFTRAVTFPAVDGREAAEATYDFVYRGPVRLQFDVPGVSPPPGYDGQFLLAQILLPAAGPASERSGWSFDYDLGAAGAPGTGELVRRRLPAGAAVQYDHATYSYTPPGTGTVVHLREVVRQHLFMDPESAEPDATWSFARERFSSAHSVYAIVTDPFGNDTVHQFGRQDCWYGCEAPWNAVLTTSVKMYAGRADGTGRLLRTRRTRYGADDSDRAYNIVPTSEWTVHHDVQGKLSGTRREERGPLGHFARTLEFGFAGPSVTGSLPSEELPYRQTLTTYEEVDPGDAERWALWFLDKAVSHVVADGAGRPLRRTTTSYADDGRVLERVSHLDPASADPGAAGNVLTRFLYDPLTLNLERSYRQEVGRAEGHGTRLEYQDGVLLGRVHVLDPQRPDAPDSRAFDYPSNDLVREPVSGTVTATMAPSGVRTDLSYDLLGRLTRLAVSEPGAGSAAVEHPTAISYPSLRETIVSRGPASEELVRTRYLYDALGRLVEVRRLAETGCEAIQRTRYDAASRVTFVSEWGFDPACAAGEQVFDPERGTLFDRSVPGAGGAIQDPLGRVWRVTTADGKSTSQRHNGASTVLTADVAGRASATYYERDAFGRLVAVDAPEGADGRYAYDELGRLIRVEVMSQPDAGPPLVQTRALAYDGLGRLVSATGPENGTALFTRYDAAGRLLERIGSDGARISYSYDAGGRLLDVTSAADVTPVDAPAGAERTYGPARPLARYVYDEPGAGLGAGKLTRVESFDEAGALVGRRLMRYGGPGGRISEEGTLLAAWDGRDGIDPSFDRELVTCYFYDAAGELEEMRYPAWAPCARGSAPEGVARLVYAHAHGALVGLADANRADPGGAAGPGTPLVSSVLYNAAGGVRRIVQGNGVTTDVVADAMSRPESITVSGPGGPEGAPLLRTGRYTFDGSGNIVSIGPSDPQDPEGTTDLFAYDPASRLTAADLHFRDGSGALRRVHLSYRFDDFGNLIRRTKTLDGAGTAGATVTSMAADPSTNRLASLDGQPCDYDARGNLLGDHATALLFDRANRLLAAGSSDRTEPGGLYAYDASGYRLMKVLPETGARTFYVRDGSGRLLSEFTLPPRRHDQASRRDYFHALGRVMGMALGRAPAAVQGLESSMTFTNGGLLEESSTWTLTLRWAAGADPDVAGYRIYSKRAGEAAWTLAGATTGTSFAQTGPQALRFYDYRVTALDTEGLEGPPSRSLRIVTADGAAPSVPAGASVQVERHERSLTLRWARMGLDSGTPDAEGNPSTVFQGYNVYRREGAAGSWSRRNLRPLTEPVFHDLWATDPGVVYRYRVKVLDTAGRESVGAAIGAGRPGDVAPPAPPSGLRALSGPGVGAVTLVWDPSAEPDLSGYRIYLKEGAGYALEAEVGFEPGAPRPRSHTLEGLAPGLAHTFVMTARDADSESALSVEAGATARAADVEPPLQWANQLYPWNGDPPAVLVVWDGAVNAAGYRVYRKLAHEPWWAYRAAAAVWPPRHRIFTDASFDHCRAHTYLVRAEDAGGREAADPPFEMFAERMLRPAAPRASSNPDERTITISWDGLLGCTEEGNGFRIVSWIVKTGPDPDAGVELPPELTSHTFFYSQTDDPDAAHPFAVYARVRDLDRYRLDPEDPLAEFDSFISEDLCASIAAGEVGGELTCGDLSNNNPGGGGGGVPEPDVRETRRLAPHFQDRHRLRSPSGELQSGTIALEGTEPVAVGAGSTATSVAEPAVIPAVAPEGRRVAVSRAMMVTRAGAGAAPATLYRFLYFHHDHLGSIRVVTDAAGAKVAERAYLPFGEELSDLGPPGPAHGFTGHERDSEAGLDYMLARHYGPATGRFTSADPLGLAELVGTDAAADYLHQVLIVPGRLNGYAFGWGSPLSHVDPTGLAPQGFGASIAAARMLIRSWLDEARGQAARLKVSARIGGWLVAPAAVAAACSTANPLACTAGFLAAEYAAYQAAENLQRAFELEAGIKLYQQIDLLLESALDLGRRGDWDQAIAFLSAALTLARALTGGPAAGVILEISQAIEQAEARRAEAKTGGDGRPGPPPDPLKPGGPGILPSGPGVDAIRDVLGPSGGFRISSCVGWTRQSRR